MVSKTPDTLTIQSETIDTSITDLQPVKQIVTKEFLDLVKYLDSLGFIGDSARFQKTYRRVNQQRPLKIENYLFYELTLEETVPILEHDFLVGDRTAFEENRMDSTELKRWNEWRERWEINKPLLVKVEKIIAYFYVEKSLFDGTGSGTYYDGIIEEWKFPDIQSAKDAADDLSKKETMVYINRGAYICYLDKYMYVFHSKSAGFYTPLKKFVNYFSDKNNATIPNRQEQRKNY